MRKLFIISLLIAIVFTSCKSDENANSVADWGETEYFTKFMWKDYAPIIMEQTLVFDFNADAKKFFSGQAVFELKSKNQDGVFESTNALKLYKNGQLCENNCMKIDINDTEVLVGLEFKPEAHEGSYTLILDPIDVGGLDDIQIELENGFNAQKTNVTNPLAVQTISLGSAILIIFIVWILLSRLVIYRSVRFSKISFDYNSSGDGYMRNVRGCYKVVCTNKKKKVSILHRIFIGKVYFEINPFWEEEVTLASGLSYSSIRIITKGDYNLPDESVRKEMFVISNASGEKVNIETT